MENNEKVLKQTQDKKQNISRLEVHSKMLRSTNLSNIREFGSLLDKVERLRESGVI